MRPMPSTAHSDRCTYNGDTSADSPSIVVESTASDPGAGAAIRANPPIGAEYTPTVDLPGP